MNRMGIDWCLKNADKIVGWLREEARRAGLPFFRPVVRRLVLLAVKRSRKRYSSEIDHSELRVWQG